jgi:hypothetical protein
LIAWSEVIPGAARERIWISAPDGTHAHPISPPIDSLGQMVWLPRGRLLYIADFRLFVLEPGGKSTMITAFSGPSFSVDRRGVYIATGDPACSSGCDGGVFILKLDGRTVRRIGRNTQSTDPSLSADGTRVVFARNFCNAAVAATTQLAFGWARLQEDGCAASQGAAAAQIGRRTAGGSRSSQSHPLSWKRHCG